jgi:ribosome-dependent ATPase
VFLFRVPVRGSIAMLFLGVAAYLCATTGLGLLISSFTKTQVAAVFATAILTIMPAQNFSGLLIPIHQPEAQHSNLQLSTRMPADYPI